MERGRQKLTQQNRFCLTAACLHAPLCTRVFHTGARELGFVCVHITGCASHSCVSCDREPTVLQQKAERVCGGEIRMVRAAPRPPLDRHNTRPKLDKPPLMWAVISSLCLLWRDAVMLRHRYERGCCSSLCAVIPLRRDKPPRRDVKQTNRFYTINYFHGIVSLLSIQ